MRSRGHRQFAFRLHVLGGFFIVCLSVLLWRLWQVQVRHGREHVRAIQRQSIRRIRLNPVRGRILAAGGTVLVDNRTIHDLVFHVSEMRRPGRRRNTVEYILQQALAMAILLERPMSLTHKKLEVHLRVRTAIPLPVFTDLTATEVARAIELFPPIPGMEVTQRITRRYPLPGVATHVLGFAGRRRPPDRFALRKYSYVGNELRGRAGLEAQYDSELSGSGGSKLVRVDTLGFVHDEIGRAAQPRNGKDLILALDVEAQTAADRILAGHTGALAAVDVRSGAVLAMASSPSYNLAELTAARYAELAGDKALRPLQNRALRADYTPGSIIKPLIALAALEAGILKAQDTIACPGYHELGNRKIHCWATRGHGELDVLSAIRVSCNPFFIGTGLATGLEKIQPVLIAAGIGKRPAVDLPDLPHAATGLLPERAYAERYWHRKWIAVDTAYLSIGQGAINISPLQAAIFTAAIANDGIVYRPYLVQSVRTPEGVICRNTAPTVEHRLPVRQEHLELMRSGMAAAVTSEDGTAKMARNPAITLAAKTGTPQLRKGDARATDAWIICFGPVEEPRYAVAIVIEGGESGGRTAAPLAGSFFRAWLGDDAE